MSTLKKIWGILFAILKGTLVGLAVVIPGVSGGSMLLTIGVYEDAISITSRNKEVRNRSIRKLIPYAIGIVLGVCALSFVITWLLDRFELFTILAFCGLILGALPMLFQNIKGQKVTVSCIVVAVLMAAIMIGLPFLNDTKTETFERLDTVPAVSERIVLRDADVGDTLSLNQSETVYQVESPDGYRGDVSEGILLVEDTEEEALYEMAGDTEFLLTPNADGTMTLTGKTSGEARIVTVYRAEDTLNQGWLSALIALVLGFVAAGTMIVPGISGSMVLLVLGYYNSIMGHLKGAIVALFGLNFSALGSHALVLVPFGIGVVLGLLFVSKGIKWLLDRHPTPTYYGILALMLTSPYAIFQKATCFTDGFFASLNVWTVLVALLCLVGGFFVAFGMSKKES